MKRSSKNGNLAIVLRLWAGDCTQFGGGKICCCECQWTAAEQSRMQLITVHPDVLRAYHHFKLSLIDSRRPSYQLYLCIVDLQSLCINAISVAQRTHHSGPSAVAPHLKATEVLLASYRNVKFFLKVTLGRLNNREFQNLSSCPWPFSC